MEARAACPPARRRAAEHRLDAPRRGDSVAARAVLEHGCGSGMASYLLAELGYHVAGMDIADTAIDWAAGRFRAAGWAGDSQVGDVCEPLPFPDSRFDIVIDGDCLHCIMGDARRACLAEAYRVTRRGGHFSLSSMCGPPRSKTVKRLYDPTARCLLEDGRPFRYLPRSRDLSREVSRAGYRVSARHMKGNPWWKHLTLLAQRPETGCPPNVSSR
ncbi:class I SAM-dependent methyltransferase [Streptomyces sp. NPDC048415]|uniref:class I SAM-dependent methyltransferase n=1 Tax=Streptomyces sp. NPDC048415 TaxID=3154822 RepID=UPI003449623F